MTLQQLELVVAPPVERTPIQHLGEHGAIHEFTISPPAPDPSPLAKGFSSWLECERRRISWRRLPASLGASRCPLPQTPKHIYGTGSSFRSDYVDPRIREFMRCAR
jgi:hypothetical protein